VRRILEFVKVVAIGKPTFKEWVHIFVSFLKLPWLRCDKKEWRRRMRVCFNCPIYDPSLKRCRPERDSDLGCGCYVPFSNLVQRDCWGRITVGKDWGWGEDDQ
jgi:hypothetical protein